MGADNPITYEGKELKMLSVYIYIWLKQIKIARILKHQNSYTESK